MNQANDVIPQGDVIVVEDYVDARCVRHVHLMSNADVAERVLTDYGVERGAWSVAFEAGVIHYRVEYPFRGALDVACINGGENYRRLVVWNMDGYTSVRLALRDAAVKFEDLFCGAPQFAFIRQMPSGVEHGTDVFGMTLIESEWMLERAVAVGGRRFE